MTIDEAIDALGDALSANGVDAPRPPSTPPDLEAIDAELAPMSIPAQVRRFWERIDPATLRVWPYPSPIQPDFAIQGWRQRRDEFPGLAPLALLDVGYESHQCMSVELDSPLAPGGALFEWNLVDIPFYLRYHELADWLERMTSLIDEGAIERRAGHAGPVLFLLDPETQLPMSELRGPGTPSTVHGDTVYYDRDPLTWPVHWQRLSGIEPSDIQPRGVSHTIAELLASDPSDALEATVRGTVTSLGGNPEGTGVRITDGTGEMTIFCPTAVTALGPVMRGEFEFDVIVPTGERHRPPDRTMTAGATAVRPLSRR